MCVCMCDVCAVMLIVRICVYVCPRYSGRTLAHCHDLEYQRTGSLIGVSIDIHIRSQDLVLL